MRGSVWLMAHTPPSFGRADLALVHPEMMRQFVPESVVDDVGDFAGAEGGAFDRALKQCDAVGQDHAVVHRPFQQRNTLVKPQQSPATRHASGTQLFTARLGLNENRQVGKTVAEAFRYLFPSLIDEFFELLGRHGVSRGVVEPRCSQDPSLALGAQLRVSQSR